MTARPGVVPGLWEPHRRLLVAGIVCLITVVAIESMAVSTIMPLVEDDLGGLGWYGWTFSAFYLATLVGIVVGGRTADRTAPLVPLLVGVATFAAGLVLGGLAPSMPVLVVGRLLQGLGAGAVPAVAYVCVARGIPQVLHPRMFAVMSTSWILPSLLSPVVASAVATAVGWRWVFLGLVPVTAAVLVLAVRALHRLGPPEDPAGATRRVGGALRLAAGAGLVLAGLTSPQPYVAVPAVLGGFAVLVPALVALTPPGTLRAERGLPAAVLTRGVLTLSFFSANAFISLAVTEVEGASTLVAGLVLGGGSMAWTAGSWTQARFIHSVGPARLERLGGVLLVVGLGSLAACTAVPDLPLWCWFAAAALAGGGMGTAYSPLSVVTLAGAQRGREGAAASALQLTDVLGIAVGTGISGAVVAVGDRTGVLPERALLVVFAGAAVVGLGVVALSGRLELRRPA